VSVDHIVSFNCLSRCAHAACEPHWGY